MRPVVARPATHALVVNGGDPPLRTVSTRLPSHPALVIAADSGLDHALALGLHADVVVGDLDSVTPDALALARASHTIVEEHAVAKDASDLELALDAARARGAVSVTVVSGCGGRFDHLLASALLLTADRFADLDLDAYFGPAHVVVIRHTAALTGPVGAPCTLLAVGGPAHGVRTQGLRYALDGQTLLPGSTRGLSNELVRTTATVTVETGTLVALLPDALPREDSR